MRRVVKIGGSLLLRNTLPDDLRRWFGRQSPAESFVVVGGGELVDAIRNLDAIAPGNSSTVHWQCVELLDLTFEFFCRRMAAWHSISNIDSTDSIFGFEQTPTIVRVGAFYNRASNSSLPQDWRTTTDSIAAEFAKTINAEELVVLKACEVDDSYSLAEFSELGIVDEAILTTGFDEQRIRIESLPQLVQSNA